MFDHLITRLLVIISQHIVVEIASEQKNCSSSRRATQFRTSFAFDLYPLTAPQR